MDLLITNQDFDLYTDQITMPQKEGGYSQKIDNHMEKWSHIYNDLDFPRIFEELSKTYDIVMCNKTTGKQVTIQTDCKFYYSFFKELDINKANLLAIEHDIGEGQIEIISRLVYTISVFIGKDCCRAELLKSYKVNYPCSVKCLI